LQLPLQHRPPGRNATLKTAFAQLSSIQSCRCPTLRRGPLAPRRNEYRTASKKTNRAGAAGRRV